VGLDPLYDGSAEFRFKNMLYLGQKAYVEAHYEMVVLGGDTRRKRKALEQIDPNLSGLLDNSINDDRRFMDLSRVIYEDTNMIWYHRLDRLSLTLLPDWGSIRLGRQAITWGNGLLFNTMDLFNPFSPTDIEREYKIGDDMVFIQFYINNKDAQVLFVPRRNSENGNLEWAQSSLAGKLHFSHGQHEFDILLASHYNDVVIGGGVVGYLGNAVWRMDSTLTLLRDDEATKDQYVALTANMDYSWIWWQKNFYGFIEFYYNSLSDGNYPEVLFDPSISKRLARGDLFTLGQAYLGGNLQVELHPLVNTYVTVITNVLDPSGILQTRGVWNMTNNLELTVGGNLYFGEEGTEYGGFPLPGTEYLNKAPNNLFLWVSYYF
jgi:hypothetical protein